MILLDALFGEKESITFIKSDGENNHLLGVDKDSFTKMFPAYYDLNTPVGDVKKTEIIDQLDAFWKPVFQNWFDEGVI